MTDDLLVGIDVGTMSIKLGLYDGALQPVSETQVKTGPISGGHEGEWDAEAIWLTTYDALADSLRDVDRERVVAIGIAGMAESGCLLDASGKPTTPILLWHDRRGVRQAAAWRRAKESRLEETTGLPMTSVRSLAKWRWLVDNGASIQDRWCGVPEWLALRLTGNWVTDVTLASRTGAFDIIRKTYSGEILDLAGAPEALFPPALHSPAKAGRLLPDVAHMLGLPESAEVAIAGHDDIVAAYGAGGQPGDLIDSAGTAEALIQISTSLPPPGQVAHADMAVVPFYHLNVWAVIAGVGATGALMERVAGMLGKAPAELDLEAGRPGEYPPDVLDVRLSDRGLPVVRFEGEEAPSVIWSATLDLVAERLQEEERRIRRLVGRPDMLILVGGGARSLELSHRKKALLGLPTARLPQVDATTRGAAALAGMSAGRLAVSPSLIRNEALNV